jgi:glycerophosphoryl diester phosphodiesterase
MTTLGLSLLFPLFFLYLGCQNPDIPQDDLFRRQQSLHNPSSQSVLVAAHRALHTKFPENSLAAIRHSIEAGIDMIEIDARQTKDGVLILMHDHTVDRTTNGNGKVRELTYAEIKNLFLKKAAGDNQVHPVPTLMEVLVLVKEQILIDIDIKDAPVKKLVDLVKKTKTEEQVLFFQHHNATHDSLLLMDSTFMLAPRAGTADEVLSLLKKYKPVVMQIPPEIASADLVAQMKKEGCTVWINALGDADDLAEEGKFEEAFSPLVEMGATVIQSDRPELVLQYLRGIKRHW